MSADDRTGSDWWRAVSPYLEHALTLAGEDRATWLESLRRHDAALADGVRELLDVHDSLARESFLEESPVPFPEYSEFPGQAIGAYKLISPLGQGGMGSVWLAERNDGRFERRAALKFLNVALAGRGSEQRFKREGSILGRLAHPKVAELIDAGVSEKGRPYLVLEHVDGEHIDQYCDNSKLNVEARVRLFLDVLAAVAHAHTNLIVHRDIKPSNVLVRTDGQVKLLDFGVAKLLEKEGDIGVATLLTHEGGAGLTPAYAAPEQLTGEPVTTATDIYGLGVLLFVLLSGQHPAGPGAHSPADLIKSIVETEAPCMSDVVASNKSDAACAANRSTIPDKLRYVLRGDLDTIVTKALKKNPRERYASVAALADDLRRYLQHEPISARPDTLAYRAAKFVRRNRLAVALATLAFVASVAGVVGTIGQARRARAQRDFALRQLSRAETINDLDSFVLSDAAPSGKPFTVNELLGRAEHIAQRQHGANDSSRVELLIAIGRQYWSQDQDASAGRVLQEAYRLSRGLSERSTRAKASCALASVLARGGELVRAEILIQDGLRELSREPESVLDRVFCFERGSEVAREGGAPGQAIKRAQEAQALLKQSPFQSDLQDMNVLMNVAESYRASGQFSNADATFHQAAAQLTALGRDDTQTAGTLLNNWGLTVQSLGRPQEAEKLFRRAIAISSSGNQEQSVSPMLLVNESRVLRTLARLEEAAVYAERAYGLGQQAGDQVVVNQSLIMRAAVYRGSGDLTRAAQMLSELAPRLRANLPPGHIAFASLASEQALIAQCRGDLRNALNLANQAVEIVQGSAKAGRGGTEFLQLFLMRRSGIELDMHRVDEAVTDAEHALNMARHSAPSGAFSSYLGWDYLALGRALKAQGKRQQARAALQSASEHLQGTLGPDHPETRAARQLINDLDSLH